MQLLPDHRFCILIVLGVFYTGVTDAACDPKAAEIQGGTYKILENGTVLQYECPEGKYPYPVEYRFCDRETQWTPMRNALNNAVSKAVCKDVQCARPLEFENGVYEPRQRFYNVSQILTFTCYQGYTMRGSANRTCLPNGKWSGETTICDDGAGHCRNPGVPIGARKDGSQYRIEDQVRYTCDRGLTLMGSKERVCLESKEWSGSEPECRNSFTYDTPEEVSSKFIASLTEAVEAASSDKDVSATGKRKIKIEAGGSMNIYIVLDASRSIDKDTFSKARNAAVTLLEKIASYDISPNYGIITFATNAKVVVSTTDPQSNDADWVIRQLKDLKHQEHLRKPGTNIYKGLFAVYTMMTNQQAAELNRGLRPAPVANSTRHVIILLTDGEYNMGGKPAPVIAQISEFLSIGRDPENPREDYLDVYVFGIGAVVNMENVNELASQKVDERHSFKLKDYEDLREAFNKMIDEADTLSMCGLAKQHSSADDFEKYPWHSIITIRRVGKNLGFEQCKGSLVSEYFVLTAAHCFTIDDKADEITVTIGGERYQVAQVISHPEYTIGRLRAQGIPEFYDYDVALVKLAKKVKFRPTARPVCLPCTAGTTRALKKPHPQTTCREHEEELLPVGNIQAFFVGVCRGEGTKPGMSQRTVQIRNGEKKMACELDALKASQYKNATQVSQVVTDRFLCTGGADPQVDPNTCKGDSGGPLIIDKRLRYIQVGVISWGVVDVCKRSIPRCDDKIPRDRFPSYARDFHINIFKVLPWLRERLSDEGLDFL